MYKPSSSSLWSSSRLKHLVLWISTLHFACIHFSQFFYWDIWQKISDRPLTNCKWTLEGIGWKIFSGISETRDIHYSVLKMVYFNNTVHNSYKWSKFNNRYYILFIMLGHLTILFKGPPKPDVLRTVVAENSVRSSVGAQHDWLDPRISNDLVPSALVIVLCFLVHLATLCDRFPFSHMHAKWVKGCIALSIHDSSGVSAFPVHNQLSVTKWSDERV